MIARTLIAFACLLLSGVSAGAVASPALDAIQAAIALRHGAVGHVDSETVARLLRSAPQDVLLLDAREAVEVAVSRLPGAIQVAPDMTAEAFRQRFAGQLTGRRVVVYCSVGVRSASLISRVGPVAQKAGARSVANLIGGIFNWHNEARALVSGDAPTDRIHPYSSAWGWLIERQELISTEPENPID